jgi:phosphatidylserine decarboxylase
MMRWANEIIIPLLVSLTLVLLGAWGIRTPHLAGRTLGWIGLGFGLLLLITNLVFFRDPARQSLASQDVITSPADGKVFAVEEIDETRYFQGRARRVGIFMNIGNVHIQRLPSDGTLVWTKHVPGIFRPAFDRRAAFDNEQRWYAFAGEGKKFAVVQIAGLIARRTRCWIQEGQAYRRGDKLGMIMYGSEVDLYLPLSTRIKVGVGDVVHSGETEIGSWQP